MMPLRSAKGDQSVSCWYREKFQALRHKDFNRLLTIVSASTSTIRDPIDYAHERRWDVCIDAAAFASYSFYDLTEIGKHELCQQSFTRYLATRLYVSARVHTFKEDHAPKPNLLSSVEET
jgi:hypothetical protein